MKTEKWANCGNEVKNRFIRTVVVCLLIGSIIIRNYREDKPINVQKKDYSVQYNTTPQTVPTPKTETQPQTEPQPTIESRETETPIKVKWGKIFKDYEENQINADSLYKDRHVIVNGNITDIRVDFKWYWFDIDINWISCHITESEKYMATKLKKRQTITVEGRFSYNLIPVIYSCKILKY
jgi:hypothetical protein